MPQEPCLYSRPVPEESTPRLKARERGRARRRLRYLRQLRELQLRDAGGFVFDLYRFGERRDALVRDKLNALIVTDGEIRTLEALLGVGDRVREIRRPGVGTCAACGAFHSTDARYCMKCGAELKTAAEAADEATEAELAADEPTAEEGTVESGAVENGKESVPPEPEGDPTVVRAAKDTPAANGNGADPGAGEVAVVGASEPSRSRRRSARRRRGQR